ncbi:MAG: DEAD/DEAH box helicase family protein, partial [Proteobacteria bacterium]|nr:DEAD/DEAH box helicase family protein [Pseudomonadota bacterium]
MGFTHYHSQFLAQRVTLEGIDDDAFAKSLSTAKVQLNPHQVDAALFALAPPVPRGAILADEVGLGKTIEASLVIAQRWAEKKRRILLIVPASLRKQWTQELHEKFGMSCVILEAKSYLYLKNQGCARPFHIEGKIIVISYEFAARREEDLLAVDWDLVIFDEAHRLRNVYRKGASKRAKALQRALKDRFKILLTATPLQNSLMELYGLVSIIDGMIFGDEASFKINYGGRADAASLAILRDRLQPVCIRHLRKDVQAAGHINYTKRISSTFTFEPHDEEVKLYNGLSAYLQRPDTIAFGAKPNQLITLVVRKILGSSTFAVADTLTPDRIVYGVAPGEPGERAVAVLNEVYATALAADTPLVVTDYATAELVKVAANAFLATKISFINAMAEIAEVTGADVTQLADAIGHDARIGRRFLNAGVGFGGGCLPK